MSETLELPAIDPALIDKPAMPVAVVPPESVATLKQTVVASFVPIKAHCAQLAAKHRGAAFDFKTPKGLEAAKAARHELREEGRYAVQRLEKRLKAEANDLKKTVEAEAAEAIEHIQPVEDKLHADITARESEIEAEREKARQIEEARKEGHRSAIEAIRICIDRCKAHGMTSARIANGMEKLRAVEVGPAFEEFEEQAKRVKAETLAAMQREHDDLLAREQEAARLEAQRLENERIAAEQRAQAEALAAQQRALAEQAAELARQQAEIEAARIAALTPAAPVATAAATEGKADNPVALVAALEAAPITQDAQESGSSPADAPACTSSGAEAAEALPSGSEGEGAHADDIAPEPAMPEWFAAGLTVARARDAGQITDAEMSAAYKVIRESGAAPGGTEGVLSMCRVERESLSPEAREILGGCANDAIKMGGPGSAGWKWAQERSQYCYSQSVGAATAAVRAAQATHPDTDDNGADLLLDPGTAAAEAAEAAEFASWTAVSGPKSITHEERPARVILGEEPGPDPIDQLLLDCLELTQYAAAPFFTRFPTQPKPAPEWWAGLRERIERLQPLLAAHAGEGA